jgi:hypothetical protein
MSESERGNFDESRNSNSIWQTQSDSTTSGPIHPTTTINSDVRSEFSQLDDNQDAERDEETVPLTSRGSLLESQPSTVDPHAVIRSRSNIANHGKQKRPKRRRAKDSTSESQRAKSWVRTCLLWFCRNTRAVQSTLSCMNLLARLLFWSSMLASVLGVFWYSYELYNHG